MKNYIFGKKNTSSCVWNKGRGTHKSIDISTMTGVKNISCSSAEIQSSEEKIDGLILQHLPIQAYTYIIGFIIALLLLTGSNASASTVENIKKDLAKPSFNLNNIIEKAEHLIQKDASQENTYLVDGSKYYAEFTPTTVVFYQKQAEKIDQNSRLEFVLESIKVLDKNIQLSKTPSITVNENRLISQRSKNIKEIYDAKKAGVEQSWIIERPLIETPSDITIQGKLTTTLTPKSNKDSGIDFLDSTGKYITTYGKIVVIDNNGKRLTVSPVYNNGQITITVPADWLASAAYPVIVDPLIGANVQISALATEDNYPAIAFSGTDYLVVWHSGTPNTTGTGTTAIKGIRVDINGVVQGGILNIGDQVDTGCTVTCDDLFPSVTYDNLRGRFIVVWMQWNDTTTPHNGSNIWRNIVTPGVPWTVGAPVKIFTSTTRLFVFPSVVCCDANGYYYVVYGRTGNGVTNFTTFRGATYNSDGITETAVTGGGNPVGTVNSGAITPSLTPEPRSAPKLYQLTINKILLTWENFSVDTVNGDVYANLLTITTTPSYAWGTEFIVANTPATTVHRYPNAAYDGTNVLIVYQQGGTTAADVYGRILNPSGASLTNVVNSFTISNVAGSEQSYPDVAYALNGCTNGRYNVVWKDHRNNATNGDIYSSFVTTAGIVETAYAISTNTTYKKERPAITADNGGTCSYLVTWSDQRNGAANADIYSQLVVYPNIDLLSPVSGVVGSTISINGSGFGNDPGAGNRSTVTNNVKINGVQVPDANVTFWSDISITFTIPTGTTAGTYPVTVTAESWSSNSNNLTVSAFGTATKVAFTTQPVGGSGGTVWATQPVATIQDALGNTVTTAIDNVTLSISSNPSGGTLTCTSTTVAAVNGVATFAGCKIDKAGSPYTLQAAAAGLTSAISNTFNITVGTPSQLIFSTQPVYGITGTAWTTQPVVTIQDAGGNNVTTATNSITLAIGTNPGGGVLVCTTNPLSAVSGSAGFSGCQINMAGNGYTLTASATGLTGATSVSFNIIQALQISTVSLPNGYEWLSYSTTVIATGGVSPYTWSISSGNLPNGLTINSSSGVISGTPNAFGTYNFTVQVTDVTNPTIQTAAQAFSVTIYQLTTIDVTPANPVVTPGQTVQFTATGTYSDNNTSDISTIVTWGSTNPSIATVNSTGLASGVVLGNVTITATK